MEFLEKTLVTAQENSARQNQRRAFINGVLQWIQNAQHFLTAPWRTVSLAFSNPQEFQPQLQRFIRIVVDRNPEELAVDFSNPGWAGGVENFYERIHTSVQLPFLYEGNAGALRVLNLSSCYFPAPAPAGMFSRFQRVSLSWIRVENLQEMVENSAFLETLSLKNCCYVSGEVRIISRSLRSLVMEKSRAERDDHMLQLTIDSPEMNRFVYSGVVFTLISPAGGLNRSLEEASLDFDLEGVFETLDPNVIYGGLDFELQEFKDYLYRILQGLGNVRSLSVCTYMLQVIPGGIRTASMNPKLVHLKHLTLKASLRRDEFNGIIFFLRSCPNLEVLTIDLTTPPRFFQGCDLSDGAGDLYRCVETKLKRLVVVGFRGIGDEKTVLRYILRCSKVLEGLRITISKERNANGDSLEQVYVARVYDMLASRRDIGLSLNRNA